MTRKSRSFLLALLLVLCTGLAACSQPAGGDVPPTEKTAYGCQPQSVLSVFDNSFAIASERGDCIFYKSMATGSLMRAGRDMSSPVVLAQGQITGIGFEDGSLFYARVIEGETSQRSELVRADARGENPQVIFSTERMIRQMLIVDRLIYFVAYNEESCELWRCNLKGQSLITVAGDTLGVGDYTLGQNTVYFNMVWAEELRDYSTYRCGIAGAGLALTGFRRGGSFFFAGDSLYSAVPYGDDQVMLEALDPQEETDEPYLLEAGGSMVSALWFSERYLYFALPGSRNLARLDLESRAVEELYADEEEGCFTGIALAAGRLILCDSQGRQYTALPGEGMTLTPLEETAV